MAEATKKIARRVLKRVNGVLTVVFVDAVTGEVLTNTDGYTFETADGMPGVTTPSTPKPAEEAPTESTPRSSSNQSYDQGHKDWLAKRVPDDDGNPFDEIDKQMATVKGGVDGVRDTLTGGLMGLGARLFGGAIGKGIGEDIGADIRENGVTGAGDAVRNAGAAVQETVGGLGDTIKGGIAGLFGGGDDKGKPNTPTPSKPTTALAAINDQYPQQIAPSVVDNSDAYAAANLGVGQLSSVDGLVIHHTGGRGTAADVVNVLAERGYGVQYIMERDGTIVRVVPEGTKTEHTRPGTGPGEGLTNSNVEGIEIIASDDNDLTPQQLESFAKFGVWHSATHGYDPRTRILGHGEINGHKQATEGQSAKAALLSFLPEAEQVLASAAQSTGPAPVQTAAIDPKTMGVDPGLLKAVQAYRAVKPLAPSTQVTQGGMLPANNLGDQLATSPITGGQQQAPKFDARYDPTVRQAVILPQQETVSSQGLHMGEVMPQPQVMNKVADAGFMPSEGLPESQLSVDNNHYLDALLSTLHEAEGSPKANQLFGYGEFDDFSQHPNVSIAWGDENNPQYTTSAGLFQINKPTWDEFAAKAGVNDFSEESQWAVARRIAMDEYKKDTGRDLASDLATGNKDYIEQAYSSLANRWASLPKGVQANSKMNDLLTSFETHSAFSPPAVKENAPAQPAKAFKNPAMDEPVTAAGVTNKITRPTTPTPTHSPPPSGGFMGSQKNAPSSSSSSTSGPTVGGQPNKTTKSSPTAQPTSQKQGANTGGFVPRPTTSTTSTKVTRPTTPTTNDKNKTGTNQVTQTNTKTTNTGSNKSKGKN